MMTEEQTPTGLAAFWAAAIQLVDFWTTAIGAVLAFMNPFQKGFGGLPEGPKAESPDTPDEP